MVLRHAVSRLVRAPPGACLECAADPESFLGASRYTYVVKRLAPGLYEVVFRWRKLGVTRYYRVRLRVRREDGRVVYESTPDSDYPFRLEITLEEAGGATRVRASAEMRAGLMADLLGRRDYASFVEELVDRGLAALARRLASQAPAEARRGRPECTTCLLYEQELRRCLVLGARVEDPSRPPCQGRDYIPAWIAEAGRKGG